MNQNCMHIETESRSISANACYKASRVRYLQVESIDAGDCLRLLTTGVFRSYRHLMIIWLVIPVVSL